MDAFNLHNDVVLNYKKYLKSFTNIKDKHIKDYVDKALEKGIFIPDPLIQFNPAYTKSKNINELIKLYGIHDDFSSIFSNYTLFKHQCEAIQLGTKGKGFIVTSGTGSGKSLTYLGTIFDYILKQPKKEKGVKAIIVYPMNALINSQEQEIQKYHLNYLYQKMNSIAPNQYQHLSNTDKILEIEKQLNIKFPISYRKYTGQENKHTRSAISRNIPDIILTNYMMLELIMTRQTETWMRDSIEKHLRFLVFDELHTYRGRKGADISFLVRRIKKLAKNQLVFIGTSATMMTEGTVHDQKKAVAKVAETIFSAYFDDDQIINESLSFSTQYSVRALALETIVQSMDGNIDTKGELEQFIQHPLVIWIEREIALSITDDTITRGKPLTLRQIAEKLHQFTRCHIDHCQSQILNLLKWGEHLNRQVHEILPFKLHQFISQTNTVYVTLDHPERRQISIDNGRYIKNDRQENYLYPILFSRHSGYEFICVELDHHQKLIKPRDPDDLPDQITLMDSRDKTIEDFSSGYLIVETNESLWDNDMLDNLPDSWFTQRRGERYIKPYYDFQLPRKIYYDMSGKFSFSQDYTQEAWYMPAKLRIDITSGIIYDDIKTKETTKLMRLGNEGRSTATTLIAYSVIQSLFEQKEGAKNQKLLSFTDNRQDASLQTGHFNDFITIVRLRSALYHALQKNINGIKVHEITERVAEELNLHESEFARAYNTDWPDDDNTSALKDYLLIRILYDLKRGWRYILPNLEQCGLLQITYHKLDLFVQQDAFFKDIPVLSHASMDDRIDILTQILNFFRTSYAIDHYKIVRDKTETENFIKLKLDDKKLWSLDKQERIETPYYLVLNKPGNARGLYTASMGARSNLGKYFKRLFSACDMAFPGQDNYVIFMESICDLLKKGNFLIKDSIRGSSGRVDAYRLRTDAIIWKPGDRKTILDDKIRMHLYKKFSMKPNSFFQELYSFNFTAYDKQIIAREHTAQISNQDRIEREDDFRKGDISSLFCSPTMELGIDIDELNVVHMRNVPPNPTNYAQRSGRAGRSGQAAVVFTYCASSSAHDRNYFKHKEQMVSGAVIPPRIDLINEELIRSHFNAYILMELSLNELNISVDEVLDLTDPQNLPVKKNIIAFIEDQQKNWMPKWIHHFSITINDITDQLLKTSWYHEKWLEKQAATFVKRFDQAFNRWRFIYQNAVNMKNNAQLIIDDPTIKYESQEAKAARRQRAIAEKQIALLRNEQTRTYGNESEFYVFRYMASEGFLPGYNFTRLPIRTYAGYHYKDEGEFISRPRFLAIREFGPMNLLYHNGSIFRINKMMLMDVQSKMNAIKISKKTGYAFLNADNQVANNDPITNDSLQGGDQAEVINNLIEISDSEAWPQKRISCEEEERLSRGFDIHCYFRYPNGMTGTTNSIIKTGDHSLIRVIYGPATELILINRKWNRSRDRFLIDNRNGKWLRQSDLTDPEVEENANDVMLFARDTADTLYLQPMAALDVAPEQIISLSYALKKGMEDLFKVEENEISVMVMGDNEHPNIMFYESSEGSLGILSQLVQYPKYMKQLFKSAYEIIHYDLNTKKDKRPDLPKATYDDLLSYYNQTYHDQLDRHCIKDPLEYLMDCRIEDMYGDNDRESQYQHLLNTYDKNSQIELAFIQYLYTNEYALPDRAQVNLSDYYISADFVYQLSSGPVLIFCDGSVHDDTRQKEEDSHKRTLLRDAGFDVIEWHYKEPLTSLVKRRKDVFVRYNKV